MSAPVETPVAEPTIFETPVAEPTIVEEQSAAEPTPSEPAKADLDEEKTESAKAEEEKCETTPASAAAPAAPAAATPEAQPLTLGPDGLPTGRLLGKCSKWLSHGYGFITAPDTKSYFVHQTQVHAQGFRSLQIGEEVEFELEMGDKGKPACMRVTGPDGAHVKGQSWDAVNRGGAYGNGYGRGGMGRGMGRGMMNQFNPQQAYAMPYMGYPGAQQAMMMPAGYGAAAAAYGQAAAYPVQAVQSAQMNMYAMPGMAATAGTGWQQQLTATGATAASGVPAATEATEATQATASAQPQAIGYGSTGMMAYPQQTVASFPPQAQQTVASFPPQATTAAAVPSARYAPY